MGLSGNQLAIINNYFKRLKFFIWSKNNCGEIHVFQGLDWLFASDCPIKLFILSQGKLIRTICSWAKLLQSKSSRRMKVHGSYNLKKVLNFSGRLNKSWNSVKVLEKYLFSLLGLKKSLKSTTLFIPHHFL